MQTGARTIQVYLSHSYRPEDRSINIAVWQLLNAQGLTFAVDPPDREGARPMDVTFIERMMQVCGAFVAIVPDRSRNGAAAGNQGDPAAGWSAYQALECRLALRAGKPRLIILENALDRGPLPDDEPVLYFKRTKPNGNALSDDFQWQLSSLLARAQPERPAELPKIGLLRWRPGRADWDALIDRMRDLFEARRFANFEVIDVDERTPDHVFLSRARRFGVVVADLNPAATPPHLTGLLHGAAVPLYRCCLVGESELTAQWAIALGLDRGPMPAGASTPPATAPRLLHGYRVDDHMQPVRFWSAAEPDAAARAIVAALLESQQRERLLEDKSVARDYFLSLRGNNVFISTPGSLDTLSGNLRDYLEKTEGIPTFHYKRSTMKGGELWKQQLDDQIHKADLLLGLITADYWDRPECVDELESAVRRWERHEMMLLLYRKTGHEPMPDFLARYQANTLDAMDDPNAVIAGEVRARFSSHAREASDDQIEQAAELVGRHLEPADRPRLADKLEAICALDDAQVARILERLQGAPDPARKLVRILLGAIHEEPYGGAAFARLCLHLRSQERDAGKRAWLNSLFSELCLLPNLHDLRHWKARRVRREVGVRLRGDGAADVLRVTANAVGAAPDPLRFVRAADAAIAAVLEVDDPDNLLASATTRLRIDCDVDDLTVPVEWATPRGLQAPMALARPVYRSVRKLAPLEQRATLEQHFGDNLGAPPRVLLFGAPSLQLPQVGAELSMLENQLKDGYQKWEWPADVLVQRVAGPQATREQLQLLVEGSDFDVLHLAGHAGFVDGQPVFEVAADGATAQHVRADELANWLRNSMVRFVYLSCCEGAATALTQELSAGWRKSLCKSLLQAGVAEVMAFFWKIEDGDAMAFTSHFYEGYFPCFDAPGALLAARLATGADSPLWASSVLVRQAPSSDR